MTTKTILTIVGNESSDSSAWVEMLAEMYKQWAVKNKLEVEVTPLVKGELSVCVAADVFDKLEGEAGVHRLCRISPFDEQHRRMTTFAAVGVSLLLQENIRDVQTRSYTLDPYTLVKDFVTCVETDRAQDVLAGHLELVSK